MKWIKRIRPWKRKKGIWYDYPIIFDCPKCGTKYNASIRVRRLGKMYADAFKIEEM